METPPELARYEQRFRRAGLPLFIEDFSPTHDIFTRATPLLALVFIAEMLGATSLTWPFWVNLLAAFGGLAVLIGGFGLLNRFRGRPFWSFPTRFGIPELAGVRAAARAAAAGHAGPAAAVLRGRLRQPAARRPGLRRGRLRPDRYDVLGPPAARRTELANSVASLVRALPLLLVFSLVLFVNTEMWQVFSGMPVEFIVFSALAFALLSDLFLMLRLPKELDQIERDAGSGPPLRRIQRLNLSISLVIRQWMQVLVVSTGRRLVLRRLRHARDQPAHLRGLGNPARAAWSYEFDPARSTRC